MDLLVVSLIWIGGFGGLFYFSKERLARFFIAKSKFPKILNYFTIATPVILIEEFLTCEIPFLQCIVITLPAFWLMLLGLYFVYQYTRLDYLRLSLIFGLAGWANEMFLVGRIFTYNFAEFFVITLLVIPIYFVVALMPSYYLAHGSRLKRA